MTSDFERSSYMLAVDFEKVAADANYSAAIVAKACCWVLAGLVIQASQDGLSSVDEALRVSTETLIHCVARLAADGMVTSGRVQ